MTTNGESHGRCSTSAPPRDRNEANAQLNDLLQESSLYLDEDTTEGFKQGIIYRSLEILLQQLYSTEPRFIHEIIQTADDNAYGKSATNGIPPTFSLSLKVGRTGDINTDNANPGKGYILETACSEDGFSMSQMTALTDIGESTKTKCKDAH